MEVIPEVAAVVAAAKDLVANHRSLIADPALRPIVEAVEALAIRETRPAGQVTHEETERTWGDVVTGDEILSAKTGRWYEVRNSVIDAATGTIKINIKGNLKPIIRPLGDPVKVKRGIMGDAVDTLDILWSGVIISERIASTGAGPMITEQEEGE